MVQKILLLSSNPRRDLNLEREVGDLIKAVQRLGNFEVRIALAVRPDELQELFLEHKPKIVHFCGHGAGVQGVVLQDQTGQEQVVSTEALSRLFKIFSNHVDCAVFNACDTEHQAAAIVAHINYAIGMSEEILDKAAYIFAVGFYQGLGYGESIEQAYELGCNAIQLQFLKSSTPHSDTSRTYRKLERDEPIVTVPEHLKPVLKKKQQSSISIENPTEASQPLVSPTLSNLPPAFAEKIEQEIDRKDYKDQVRAAYDNFGQFSAENAAANLTKTEYAQRKILVSKVREFWIEGFLKPSLQGNDVIKLDLKDRSDAIADLTQGIEALSVELDDSYEELQETRIYEEMGQGRTLLILGDPGAGKTIALLQLAQRLIDRSEENLSLPMPVVFNLSSWAKDRKSIVDWLIDELREKYQVPKLLSEPWITQQQLILLLDGLDEVKEAYRNDCVRALNEFIGLFSQTEVAVCSRVRDYEALTERLQLSSALCLQPLSSKQVYQFLDSGCGSLAGLKALLKREEGLEQFAKTPLTLNFMSVAYQGWSAEKLMQDIQSTSDWSQHLFDTYINRRLERGATSEYLKDQILRWLSWLASHMVKEKQTIFLIEKMQPNWLQNRREEGAYRIKNFLSTGLMVGLTVGLVVSLSAGLNHGLSSGLSVGLSVGLMGGFSKEVLPLEKISWSWQRVKFCLMPEFLAGCAYGFIFGLIGSLIFELVNWLLLQAVSNLIDVLSHMLFSGLIFGLSVGLIFALCSGLTSTEIEQRVVPNQGIRRSWKNCVIVGLVIALMISLILGLTLGLMIGTRHGLISGLIFGLILGSTFGLKYGGVACIQHFNLRQILYKKGRIPWNYAKFLDFASERLLMKKVGGGYIFFHRMLMEHIANKISG